MIEGFLNIFRQTTFMTKQSLPTEDLKKKMKRNKRLQQLLTIGLLLWLSFVLFQMFTTDGDKSGLVSAMFPSLMLGLVVMNLDKKYKKMQAF